MNDLKVQLFCYITHHFLTRRKSHLSEFKGLFEFLEESDVNILTSLAVLTALGVARLTGRGEGTTAAAGGFDRGEASETVIVETAGAEEGREGTEGVMEARGPGWLREERTSLPASVRVSDWEMLSSSSGNIRMPWASSNLDKEEIIAYF